ncbi:MAG: 2-oxo acid dehydrogenase subunit E2, partial [Acidobacteriia bacterium]|nr:2-oxo acid dehydrogenase subunit E2 [Terriglobia bacterium]
KARAGKLTPDEMTGSTFTISNMGMLDVENFTAIINPGESAILAVSSLMKQPVVRDDQIAIRSLMKMTLSSDHRIIDGALAAQFINAIRQKLEEISFWKRSI